MPVGHFVRKSKEVLRDLIFVFVLFVAPKIGEQSILATKNTKSTKEGAALKSLFRGLFSRLSLSQGR